MKLLSVDSLSTQIQSSWYTLKSRCTSYGANGSRQILQVRARPHAVDIFSEKISCQFQQPSSPIHTRICYESLPLKFREITPQYIVTYEAIEKLSTQTFADTLHLLRSARTRSEQIIVAKCRASNSSSGMTTMKMANKCEQFKGPTNKMVLGEK